MHFWVTFLGTYMRSTIRCTISAFVGVPRRYFANGDMAIIDESVVMLNQTITIAALIVGVFQIVFIWNLIYSYFRGKDSGHNPWKATSLEWQTPETPPRHGNWEDKLPTVYRWAYDYSVPGVKDDFIPQTEPRSPEETAAGRTE